MTPFNYFKSRKRKALNFKIAKNVYSGIRIIFVGKSNFIVCSNPPTLFTLCYGLLKQLAWKWGIDRENLLQHDTLNRHRMIPFPRYIKNTLKLLIKFKKILSHSKKKKSKANQKPSTFRIGIKCKISRVRSIPYQI